MSLDELRERLERHARPDLATAIDGVRICKVDYAASPESSMSGTVLAVTAQGGKRLALGDRFYDYGAGQYLVASVDVPVTGHVMDAVPGKPALGFGMTVEPAAIAELLLQAGPGDLPRTPGTARPGIAVSDAPEELLDAIVRLLRLLEGLRVLRPALTRCACAAGPVPPLWRCPESRPSKRIVQPRETILLARRQRRCFPGGTERAMEFRDSHHDAGGTREAGNEGRRPLTERLRGEMHEVPHAGPDRSGGRRRAPRQRAAERTVTADNAVARALDIGPDSSPAERTIDITTLGRRSGIPRRIEVWFHRVDGRWYLSGRPGPRSWYANLRAHPRFVVHLKHGVMADLPATARPVDEPTRRRVITAVLDLQDRPDVAARVSRRQDLDEWLAGSPLVEIVFDDEQLRAVSPARSR
jgi:deazaflavin-dependent oxidoreductase (nitroreductase family)